MNCDQYNDIIDLPHHVSATRPRMSMIDRAAQFRNPKRSAASGLGRALPMDMSKTWRPRSWS